MNEYQMINNNTSFIDDMICMSTTSKKMIEKMIENKERIS